MLCFIFFFFQAEDGIRDYKVTGVQTCALPIYPFYGPMYNNGEIFYSIVPDPAPTLKSCAHTVAGVKSLVPVTFIHEFQHMISYNHHVLQGGKEAEILWLNEALSHYAEELGGRSFLPGDTATYCTFVFGDVYNSAQYFQAPQTHFLVDTSGIGALANRGAYWLFLRYLIDQYSTDTSFARSEERRVGKECRSRWSPY